MMSWWKYRELDPDKAYLKLCSSQGEFSPAVDIQFEKELASLYKSTKGYVREVVNG
jgi:hypothetical protein